ncbi:DUF6164 family protein [Kaarinaea lacus]
MPVRLFSLRHVPDDEAQEIRDLLEQNQIDFYETAPGNWGISAGAFWLKTDERLEEARQIIDVYQQKRAQEARLEYEDLKRAGRQRTLLDNIREKPLQLLLYIAAILFILYVTLKPFLHFGR